MENKCFNCRYYNNGECCNKDFRKSINPSAIKYNFITLTESGVLAENIKENDNRVYDLANIVLENLTESGYIKKNKKKVNNYKDIDNYEEFLTNAIEVMDEIISKFVIPQLEDIEVEYNVNPEFGCRFWE